VIATDPGPRMRLAGCALRQGWSSG
jgi:hypothetical protein